jgi:hypothetical protein
MERVNTVICFLEVVDVAEFNNEAMGKFKDGINLWDVSKFLAWFNWAKYKGEEVGCFVARFFVLLVFNVCSDSLDISCNFFVVEGKRFGDLLFEL